MTTTEFVNKTKSSLDMLFTAMNFKSDLTLEALKHNEKIIAETYPYGHKPMTTTLIPFSIHLGETIIKSIPGAKWVEKEIANLYDIEIITPVNGELDDENLFMHSFPMQRVHKFWNENREFNMSSLLNTLIFISENDVLDPKFKDIADKDGWFQIGGGDMVRIFKKELNKDDLPN